MQSFAFSIIIIGDSVASRSWTRQLWLCSDRWFSWIHLGGRCCGGQCSLCVSTVTALIGCLVRLCPCYHTAWPLPIEAPHRLPNLSVSDTSCLSQRSWCLPLLTPACISVPLSHSPPSPAPGHTDFAVSRRPVPLAPKPPSLLPVFSAWKCIANLCSCIQLRPNIASLGKFFTDPSNYIHLPCNTLCNTCCVPSELFRYDRTCIVGLPFLLGGACCKCRAGSACSSLCPGEPAQCWGVAWCPAL